MKQRDPSARPPPWPRDGLGRFKPGKRVICTHFVMQKRLSAELWKADIRFTARLSPATVRGYHFWAVPYVRLMRRHRWAEAVMLPLATWRAQEVAFQMGKRARGSYLGKLVRLVGEPICWLVGQFAREADWSSLYQQGAQRT